MAVITSLVMLLMMPTNIEITPSSGYLSISTSVALANPEAPVYQNMSEVGVASASEITIPAPTGFSAGDLFVVFITKDDDVLINEDGDWATLHRVTSGTGCAIYCAWRIAQEGDISWTWTGDAEAYYGVILRYTGHNGTTPINISDVAVDLSLTPTAPDVLTTRDDCMIFRAFGADGDDEPYTVPDSPFVQVFNDSYATTGGAGGYEPQTSAGQTGTGVFGMAGTKGNEWGAVTVAIQPSVAFPDISNVGGSYDYGVVDTNSTYTSGLTKWTVTNNSGASVDIDIHGHDATGGNGWTLSDTATASSDTFGLKAGLEGGDYTIVVKKSEPYNDLVTGLADEATQNWGLKLYSPTSHSDGVQKSATITITASLS